MNKQPNDVDKQVGARLRMFRLLLGKTQEQLADTLGVTFQQVQKYEKGINRMSVGRLEEIARILQIPPALFFERLPGAPVEKEFPNSNGDLLSTPELLQLNRSFTRIQDSKVRQRIVDLVVELAGSTEGN